MSPKKPKQPTDTPQLDKQAKDAQYQGLINNEELIITQHESNINKIESKIKEIESTLSPIEAHYNTDSPERNSKIQSLSKLFSNARTTALINAGFPKKDDRDWILANPNVALSKMNFEDDAERISITRLLLETDYRWNTIKGKQNPGAYINTLILNMGINTDKINMITTTASQAIKLEKSVGKLKDEISVLKKKILSLIKEKDPFNIKIINSRLNITKRRKLQGPPATPIGIPAQVRKKHRMNLPK